MSVLWKHFTVATCYVLLFAAFFPLLPPPLTPVGLSIVAFWRLAGLSLALSLFLYQLELEQFTLHISQNKKRKNVFFFFFLWMNPKQERNTSKCLAVSKCASSALPLARVAYNHPNNMQQDLADMKLFCLWETMTNTMAWPCETAVEEERWSVIQLHWIKVLTAPDWTSFNLFNLFNGFQSRVC